MGIIVLLMGLFAMAVGFMLIVGGISQLVFAIKARTGIFTIIPGALTVIVGGYMVCNPGAALATLTLFLAIYLIISGFFEVMMAFQAKPVKGWGWALFSGILSVVLGAMIWSQFPLSGDWAIGILLGIKLFFSGWTLMMFGLVARGAAKDLTEAV